MHIHNIQQHIIRQIIGKIINCNLYLAPTHQKNRKGIQSNGYTFLKSRIFMTVTIYPGNDQLILIGLKNQFITQQILDTEL